MHSFVSCEALSDSDDIALFDSDVSSVEAACVNIENIRILKNKICGAFL